MCCLSLSLWWRTLRAEARDICVRSRDICVRVYGSGRKCEYESECESVQTGSCKCARVAVAAGMPLRLRVCKIRNVLHEEPTNVRALHALCAFYAVHARLPALA
eukprot:3559023-Pleurochrysis_carterae.AAC.1